MHRTHPVVRKALEPLAVPDHLVGIHGVLYDARAFVHPGGDVFLDLVRGTDATALFETSHVHVAAARKALAALPTCGTYEPKVVRDFEGTYAALRDVALAHLPSRASRATPPPRRALWMASTVVAHLALFLVPEWWTVMAVAVCNTVLGGYGHDALHRLDAHALLLDWNGLSSFEWLLEHVSSHHPHVNTPHDHDALSMEPFVRWIGSAAPLWRNALVYPIFAIGEVVVAAQGYVGHRCRWHAPPSAPAWMRTVAPWVFPLRALLHVGAQGLLVGTLCLLATLVLASIYFSYLAHLNHAPQGRVEEPCAAAHQLANTADLPSVPVLPELGLFLDRQTLHHLFPTVSHGCLDARLRAALAHVVTDSGFELVPHLVAPRTDLPRTLWTRLHRR